jgi:hypothetical protein
MYVYTAYNLGIHSQVRLPEIIPAQRKADVIIRIGKVDTSEHKEPNGINYFTGSVEELGTFLVRDGCEIIIEPEAGIDEAMLSPLILGPIMSILLRQRGLLVLHASCVNINNQAIAFMGGSGWGKSTLVTAFHTKGYEVLTDDVLPIKVEQNSCLVFPAYPQFKLLPDAATSLGQDTESLSPIFKNAPKLSYKVIGGFRQTPLKLKRIYVLAKGNNHQISPIQSQQNAFMELVRHTRAMNLIKAPEFMSSHLHLCSQLIKNVSFCRFTRKPSLADLPLLINLIEENLACCANFR